jgi:DNA polymerase II small subunit/DNA polymerase delta subunit B
MNRDKRYSEFTAICSRIRKEIREDQITGGMVGQYNASITQRLNNLKEQVEQTNIEQPLFKLSDNNDSNS